MTVLFSCPFVPVEWILAHGLRPRVGVQAETSCVANTTPSMGTCVYANRFLEHTQSRAIAHEPGESPSCSSLRRENASPPATHLTPALDHSETLDPLVIFTSRCDQMRRAADVAYESSPDRVFLMNVPATWQSATARSIYHEELRRLGQFLVRCGGREPSRESLREQMELLARRRRTVRSLRATVDARRFAELVQRCRSGQEVDVPAAEPEGSSDSSATGNPTSLVEPTENTSTLDTVPVALVGSPLMPEHRTVFDEVARHGGRLVCDMTLGGERGLLPEFDAERRDANPFEQLVDAYVRGIPDPFQRPNTPFYEWLQKQLDSAGARGLIVWLYAWCDLWRAEVQRLREHTGLPILCLETGDAPLLSAAANQRVQAFFEMLRS